jgi:hypothetical protein
MKQFCSIEADELGNKRMAQKINHSYKRPNLYIQKYIRANMEPCAMLVAMEYIGEMTELL